jgi:hypothetical protein
VVASRGLQAEPVATDGLVHLLSTSKAARGQVMKLLSQLCPSATIEELAFSGQVIDPLQPGRPDVVGRDASGNRLVLEAKFDAELTATQLTTAYLDQLPAGAPGVLLFLVPKDRLPALWSQVLRGPGGQPPQPLHFALADEEPLTFAMGDGRTLAAISWELLLAQLREALMASQDVKGLADLSQIEGLTKWRSQAGWTPLLPGDLPLRSGRQLSALIPAVLDAAGACTKPKTRNGSGDGGPGRWVTTDGGWSFWVGIWFDHWARYEASPVWAQVIPTPQWSADSIASALEGAGIRCMRRASTSDVLVPLLLRTGAELGQIKADIVTQLIDLGHVLDALTTV